jgi:hypothetical protein
MIPAPLVGIGLLVSVATGPLDDAPTTGKLTAQQKSAVTQPFVRSATACIVQAVVGDRRYSTKRPEQLGNLIVASMPSCVAPMRAMIDAYDRYYGEGSGGAFFTGPYLDMLPEIVVEAAKKAAP